LLYAPTNSSWLYSINCNYRDWNGSIVQYMHTSYISFERRLGTLTVITYVVKTCNFNQYFYHAWGKSLLEINPTKSTKYACQHETYWKLYSDYNYKMIQYYLYYAYKVAIIICIILPICIRASIYTLLSHTQSLITIIFCIIQ